MCIFFTLSVAIVYFALIFGITIDKKFYGGIPIPTVGYVLYTSKQSKDFLYYLKNELKDYQFSDNEMNILKDIYLESKRIKKKDINKFLKKSRQIYLLSLC